MKVSILVRAYVVHLKFFWHDHSVHPFDEAINNYDMKDLRIYSISTSVYFTNKLVQDLPEAFYMEAEDSW